MASSPLNVNAAPFEPLPTAPQFNTDAAPFEPLNLEITEALRVQQQGLYFAESGLAIPFVIGATVWRISLRRQDQSNTSTPPPATVAKDGEDACTICYDNVPDCKFPDCSHADKGFLCAVCADKIVQTSKKCPLCRKPVTGYTKL